MGEFLSDLHDGNFAAAAELYAGDYYALQEWNPAIDPEDRALLLRSGCTDNGLRCMERYEVVSERQTEPREFSFDVHLYEDDGTIVVLGGEGVREPLDVRLHVPCQADGRSVARS